MKKLLIAIFVFLGIMTPVKAADYSIKELIPEGVTTTVRGDNFMYKDILYQGGFIKIGKIRNNSLEKKTLTVSIGLFDKNKKNIGTINYCQENTPIESKGEVDELTIDVKNSYMASGKTHKDIRYISVIGENLNCRTDGATDYVDQTVEQIGMAKNNTLNDDQLALLNIIKWIGIILFALFVYKFLFTNAYRNMDGTDVRQEYTYINKELRKERELEEKLNPPQPKVVKTNKTKEILKQEKEQNAKSNQSDLHDMYK